MDNRVELSHHKVALGSTGSGIRIVAMSDLHPGTSFIPVDDLIEMVNQENPDVFILVGDIVDRHVRERFAANFRSVEAKKSKLAVLGNLEYSDRLDIEVLRQIYAGAGIRLLVNELTEIDGIAIVGLDDYIHGSPDFNILTTTDIDSKPIIWISHCPKPFDRVSGNGTVPSLMLSGHTHGGQIALLGKALITPYGSGTYKKGWYSKKQHLLYVMRGIGASYRFPFRIGVKPEILVLDIE